MLNIILKSILRFVFLVLLQVLIIKNIELGYTLSPAAIKKIGLTSLRIYANVQNAFTFTKFKGFDPEQTTDQTRAEAYPQVRIMTAGLNVNF